MVSLAHLWLPILLSGIGVFIASSIIHMTFKFWHHRDYHGFPNESDVATAIRKGNAAPGMYMLPYCDMKEMKTPEAQEKFKQGPVGFMILRANGAPEIGKGMVLWFIYCLVVAFFAAYVAGSTLAAGTAGLQVFRLITTVAFMGFAFGSLPMGIWWGQPWKAVTKDVIDGLIYALITAALFAALWPK